MASTASIRKRTEVNDRSSPTAKLLSFSTSKDHTVPGTSSVGKRPSPQCTRDPASTPALYRRRGTLYRACGDERRQTNDEWVCGEGGQRDLWVNRRPKRRRVGMSPSPSHTVQGVISPRTGCHMV
jgi:hypothetical protein